MQKSDWKENLKWDELTTDPTLIKWLKKGRKQCRLYKNLITTLVVISIISSCFVYFGIEDKIKDFLLYKVFLIFLNLVTFIGIVFPITVSKTLTESDVKNTIDKKNKEDEQNKRIKDRASL